MNNKKRQHVLLKVKTKSSGEILKINIYRKQSRNKSVVVMIGGSGNDRNAFSNICHGLVNVLDGHDVCSYSIRGLESGKTFPVFQQIIDLHEVLDCLVKKGYSRISMVSTSMGSISMCAVLVDKKYKKYIHSGIFLNPADYYLKFDVMTEPETWSGYKEYGPTQPTVSSLLNNLESKVKISVVSFLLKNCVNGNYFCLKYSERGVDVPNGHSRLSVEMTKSFFENTPTGNQGVYVENTTLPHAFERDGDVTRNEIEVVNIICKLVGLKSFLESSLR